MKKWLAMLLVLSVACSITACSTKYAGDSAKDTPVQVLTKVWDTYEEDEKFNATGGEPANSVAGKPGKFDVADIESLDAQLGFPQASVALLDDAASLVHVVGNMFTAGAYHVTDTNEIELLTSDLQDNILHRQWVDSVPDKVLIVSVGENTVISVFGEEELVDTFKTKLLSVYGDVKVYNELFNSEENIE